jgi:hypothetical protein
MPKHDSGQSSLCHVVEAEAATVTSLRRDGGGSVARVVVAAAVSRSRLGAGGSVAVVSRSRSRRVCVVVALWSRHRRVMAMSRPCCVVVVVVLAAR